ncbi:MAG: DUF3429 domain-containing protein [Methylobacterium sp.]|uniref:DUF3429 domain-containing protein n=1 Tax=Methylobacterium sp. TaxID=409 RepID=UPI0025E90738|nr:DUF3429 domain-containing protein [Methylobacterium sp.]MBX9933826.1 DUF3429 domain-containing protein [Methylobacterium sp.]
MRDDARTITVTERPEVPALALVFGFGPMVPLVVGAAAAWWWRGETGEAILALTVLWGCAILLFLSGVRRGLSFRTEGGETLAQIATMLALFGLGFLAFVAVFVGRSSAALILLMIGFTGIALFDPPAARRGEAPLFMARLRPLQMPIAVLSLGALLALKLVG